jgi:hypothetical protein
MYSNQDIDRMDEGNANYTFITTLIASPPSWNPYPIYREDGTLRLFRGGGRDPYLYTLQSTGNNITRERFVGSLSIEYKIAEHLNFRSVTRRDTIQVSPRITKTREVLLKHRVFSIVTTTAVRMLNQPR